MSSRKREKQTLDEFTWPEVYKELSKNDIAYLPMGPQETHGSYLPLGTDVYVSTAVCILASKKTGGVVLNPLMYNFSGATSAFRGTISIPMDLQIQLIKAIARNLWAQKIKRIFLVSMHGPNYIPISAAVRDLFQYENIVTAFYNPYSVIDEAKWKKKIPNFSGTYQEAACCCAAMKLMGKEDYIPDLSKLKNEKPVPYKSNEGLDNVYVGYRYNHLSQHLRALSGVTVENGMKILEESAGVLASMAEPLKKYVAYVEKGGDAPFSVKP